MLFKNVYNDVSSAREIILLKVQKPVGKFRLAFPCPETFLLPDWLI